MNLGKTRHIAGAVAQGAVVLVAVTFASLLLLPKVMGWNVMTVLTGSMRPTYPPASVVAVKPVDAASLGSGDVIAFRFTPTGPPTTHRIVSVRPTPDGPEFTTKGDGNEEADDQPVEAENVIGRVVFGVPHLGRAIELVRSPLGLASLLLVPGLLLLGAHLWARRRARPDAAAVAPAAPVAPVVPSAPRVETALVAATPSSPALTPPTAPAVRQLLLATVAVDVAGRRDVLDLLAMYGGAVVSIDHARLTLSLVAAPATLSEFEALLTGVDVVHRVRTDPVNLPALFAPLELVTVPRTAASTPLHRPFPLRDIEFTL